MTGQDWDDLLTLIAAGDWQATILRQWISWDEVERAITAYKGSAA